MIWDALRGALVTRSLGLAADLRVAQALAAGPRSSGELARELDGVIEPGNAPDGAKWLDLLMHVVAGGRERTAEQWQALLGDTGWRTTRVSQGVIEAQPA